MSHGTPLFFKVYRSKDIGKVFALRQTRTTSRIRKADVKAFLLKHFPQARILGIRVLNSYKKGSTALVTAAEPLWK